jgi:lactoylglutathione lyase
MYLYETHLPVQSTEASQAFYIDVVSLEFAYRDPTRNAVFLWIGSNRRSMLGLWGSGTTRGDDFHKCHFAIAVSLSELLASGKRLAASGIACENFTGEKTTVPSVLGWMPSAQLYFRDPDGHSVEFISLLDDSPDPSFIGPLSSWKNGAYAELLAAKPDP